MKNAIVFCLRWNLCFLETFSSMFFCDFLTLSCFFLLGVWQPGGLEAWKPGSLAGTDRYPAATHLPLVSGNSRPDNSAARKQHTATRTQNTEKATCSAHVAAYLRWEQRGGRLINADVIRWWVIKTITKQDGVQTAKWDSKEKRDKGRYWLIQGDQYVSRSGETV